MKKLIFGLVLTGVLAGCGGSGNPPVPKDSSGSGSSTGTGTGGSSSSSSVATMLSLGSGTGTSFTSGAIALSSTSISAGGSASLTVTLVDQNDVPYTQSATISFTSSCISLGTAAIKDSGGNSVSSISTATGTATVTYVAQGCSGDDVITASTNVNNQPTLTATGTITVQAATLGAVSFVSASPASIGLKGTGVQETSTLVFLVSDSSGGPVSGADVTFNLSTSVGGLSLSNTTAKSGADGKVQTVVKSGTVHTTVRVTATATLNSVVQSTQSSNLAVTTGIPTTSGLSVAPTCPNVEALNRDGVNVPVTVRLADRYNNPVPDGTAVAFTAEGGKIDGQCTSGTTSTESGVCTVNWTSQTSSQPVDGRVTILATALGEDSFVDTNANGFYDTGETYSDAGEPYLDANESGTYDSGEFFLDTNGNGVRDATYNGFKGITCTGTTSTSTCSLETTEIGRQTLIVMSSSDAVISVKSPGIPSGSTASQTITWTFNVQDVNGNAMPQGTKIAVSANSNAGTINTPTSFTVPCTGGTGGTDIGVSLTRPTTINGSGTVTITVTTPGNIVSYATYTIS
ncbi:MAG: hypothetical protein ABUS47_15875 [Steroidobacter sp.]